MTAFPARLTFIVTKFFSSLDALAKRGIIDRLNKRRGVEQWQLVGLITRRSQVRVLSPQLVKNALFERIFCLNAPDMGCIWGYIW
jgi:hypothetical protein